jgi:hypothetical protein
MEHGYDNYCGGVSIEHDVVDPTVRTGSLLTVREYLSSKE